MVAGRKRWLERMQKAKQLGWIDKIPTGRRRPGVRKAPTKGIARARRIALCSIDELSPSEPTKLAEDKSLPELWAEAVREALRFQLMVLDLPAGNNVALARWQLRIASVLLKLTAS